MAISRRGDPVIAHGTSQGDPRGALPAVWHSPAKFPIRTQFNYIQLKQGFGLGEQWRRNLSLRFVCFVFFVLVTPH